MKALEDFLKPTQKELFSTLSGMYRGHTTIRKNKYILVRGEAPVMLLAHLDTVHNRSVREICKSQDRNILMSPQGIGGDDRCGVYALVTAYEKSMVKPWLLFTCDEEKGGIGANEFGDMHAKDKLPKELDDLKLLVEIDRRGKNDAVYYNCDNPEFEAYITGKGFQTKWGSYSDISVIAPELGVAAVNLSSGYYNAHTLYEYINRKQLDTVVRKVIEIIADAAKPDFPKYEYKSFGGYMGRRSSWWEDDPSMEEEFLETVPKEIRNDYEALLNYYTIAELENFRAENGDQIIPMMCESELGYSYSKHRSEDDAEEATGCGYLDEDDLCQNCDKRRGCNDYGLYD